MKFVADLHIHSKYSRATSQNMTLEEIDPWADNKGILVIGTGDFTHPGWLTEIKEKLEPAEAGLFKLKSQYKKKALRGAFSKTRFLLTAEVSGIYSKLSTKTGEKKTHRIHNLLFAPDIKTVEDINAQLSIIGNLASDGRPILGLDSEKLAEIIFNVNPETAIIPAHAWTPWFSVFGSMSGFDSMEECFGKYAKNIFAMETGLSSDPKMNWRLSQLDNIALISNSDCHSLRKIGREANIFDTELSYQGIMDAIKSGAPTERRKRKQKREKFLSTIEFFPEEGKYHYDGHRNCDVVFSPKQTKKHKNICPKCGKKLTIGVMNRVNELADRPPTENFKYSHRVPYHSLIPLDEIIAEAFGVGVNTKKVITEYENLIKSLGNELQILLKINEKELKFAADFRVAKGIKRVRDGQVKIQPGYDGEYGKIKIF